MIESILIALKAWVYKLEQDELWAADLEFDDWWNSRHARRLGCKTFRGQDA